MREVLPIKLMRFVCGLSKHLAAKIRKGFHLIHITTSEDQHVQVFARTPFSQQH